MDAVADALLQYIRKEFADAANVGPNDYLLNGVIDSLGVFNLVGYVERQFGVALADTDLTTENFQSITTLAKLVNARRGA